MLRFSEDWDAAHEVWFAHDLKPLPALPHSRQPHQAHTHTLPTVTTYTSAGSGEFVLTANFEKVSGHVGKKAAERDSSLRRRYGPFMCKGSPANANLEPKKERFLGGSLPPHTTS